MNCEEARRFCDKEEYAEASLIEKVRFRLHLWFCLACQKYKKQNKKLSNLLKKATLKTFTPAEKRALKEQIRKQL